MTNGPLCRMPLPAWSGESRARARSAPTGRVNCCYAVIAATLGVSFALAHPTLAAEVIAGETRHQRITIINYNQGRIEFQTTQGLTESVPIWEIDQITIDESTIAAEFNAAEEYLRRGDAGQAMIRFERVLRSASGYWIKLARARLLAAADGTDQFDKTARVFLDVLKDDPVAAAHLLPVNLPTSSTSAAQRGMTRLDEALGDAGDETSRMLITLVRYAGLRAIKDKRHAQMNAALVAMRLPPEWVSARSLAIRMSAMQSLLESGEQTGIVAAIDAAIPTAPKSALPQLLLLKSRTLFVLARTPEEYLAAALPAMRVAIHFADQPDAGEGLLLAARAHESSGRRADARNLLIECLRSSASTAETKERVRARLAAMGESGSP